MMPMAVMPMAMPIKTRRKAGSGKAWWTGDVGYWRSTTNAHAEIMYSPPDQQDSRAGTARAMGAQRWNQYADYVRFSGVELGDAVRARDARKASLNIGRLAFACNSCHEELRAPRQPRKDFSYPRDDLLQVLQGGSKARRIEATKYLTALPTGR